MSSFVIIIIIVHGIIIITYMGVHKFIHYVSVEQTVIILFILRRALGGVTLRTIPYMTDET
jgi:hypothetical protein